MMCSLILLTSKPHMTSIVGKEYCIGFMYKNSIKSGIRMGRYRVKRGFTLVTRKCKSKNHTRCGCTTMFRVHVHIVAEQKLCALLPEHRKLDVSYTIDDENKLQHLFWCDFESQMNYQKNNYPCPLVVLSGVNHHNQIIVFTTTLLLEQLLDAINGRDPVSVITYGDLAMKNTIKHLCLVTLKLAILSRNGIKWLQNLAFHSHLRKYVDSRISLTDFVQQFQRCLSYFRFCEIEADYGSKVGNSQLETDFVGIELSTAKVMTKEMFMEFQFSLKKHQC
ncbi:Protein FAR1-RELATED SEQUENCE 3 [Glycine soja]